MDAKASQVGCRRGNSRPRMGAERPKGLHKHGSFLRSGPFPFLAPTIGPRVPMQHVPPPPLPGAHRPPRRSARDHQHEAARSELPLRAGQQSPPSIAQGLAVITKPAGTPTRNAAVAQVALGLVAVGRHVTPDRPPAARAGMQAPEPRQVSSGPLHWSPPRVSRFWTPSPRSSGTTVRYGRGRSSTIPKMIDPSAIRRDGITASSGSTGGTSSRRFTATDRPNARSWRRPR